MAAINNDLKEGLTQVFRVSVPDGVSGMYATRIELFFKKKSASFGIQLDIVELTDGLPDTSKAVPNSSVMLKPEQILVSDNASVPTPFVFPQPIFLAEDTRYAIVVRALGGSPDYEIFTGVNGAKDIVSGQSISSNPLSEQSYFAKNQQQWAEIPNEDLKYNLYRAKFKINQTSQAMLVKGRTEILRVKAYQQTTGGPSPIAGDEVYGIAADGLANSAIYAKVVAFDDVNNYLYLRQSTGLFAANADFMIVRSSAEGAANFGKVGTTSGMIARAKVDSVFDYPAHAVAPKIGNLTNSLGSVSFEFRGTYKAGGPVVPVKETSNSDWKAITNQEELDFYDKTRYVLSRSNEVASLSSNSSVELRATLTSTSDFISPVIDLKERSLVAIRNLIGANTANEDGDYGAAKTRYISQIITLADGQEAEDLKVFITANKPPRSIIQVYAKLWNDEDPQDFDKKVWTLMTQRTDASIYSDPKNPEDYREFEFDLPSAPPVSGAAYIPRVVDPVDGDPVQYSNSNGTFIGYKKFSVKVVMAVATEEDAYNYPRLSDVRAIALQK